MPFFKADQEKNKSIKSNRLLLYGALLIIALISRPGIAADNVLNVTEPSNATIRWDYNPVDFYIMGPGGESWDPPMNSQTYGTGYFSDIFVQKSNIIDSERIMVSSAGEPRTYIVHSKTAYTNTLFRNDNGTEFTQSGAADSVILQFNLVPSAPVAKDLYINVRRGQAKAIQLVAEDPNGDALSLYEILNLFNCQVSPSPSSNGQVTVNPSGEKALAGFSYRARDSTGLYGKYAEVQVHYWDSLDELSRNLMSMREMGFGPNGVMIDPGIQSDPGEIFSMDPINYANGDLVMNENDLDHTVLGWGHKRSYSWRNGHGISLHGPGWMIEDRPFISRVDDCIVVTLSGHNGIAFQPNGGGWEPFRPYPGSLTEVGADYVFHDAYGNKAVFWGFPASLPFRQRGQIKYFYRPSGDRLHSEYDSSGNMLKMVRQIDQSTKEELCYQYISGRNSLIDSVQWRVVGTAGISNIQFVKYTYYAGAFGEYGEKNNLESVEVHSGSESGPLMREFHYRYDRINEIGALRFAVGPRACAIIREAGLNPRTVDNETLAAYADKYFEYTNMRITRQDLRTPDVDGSGTFTYAYLDSAFTNGFNTWKRRTTETYPDNSVLLVYSNYAGLPLLKVWKPTAAAAPLRLEGWRYDSAGRETWHIQPNAFQASSSVWYDETKADLLDFATAGDSPYVKNTDGRIDVRTYYGTGGGTTPATATTPGGVEGYLQYLQVKQGENGTAVNIALREYLSHSNN